MNFEALKEQHGGVDDILNKPINVKNNELLIKN